MTGATSAGAPAEVQLRMARIWLQRGKQAHAIQALRDVARHAPGLVEAYVLLGDALRQQERIAEAEAVYTQGLDHDPNLPELHKGAIDCLVAQHGFAAAFDRYELVRMDRRPMDHAPDAVLCCSVVRNERARLPFFLTYYRDLGVARFFVVDNGSTDGTLDCLAAQPDVHLWHSTLSFNRAAFGSAWFELLLRRYGRGHWWVMADADELLVYPGCESQPLPQAVRLLARHGKRALPAILLDMYSDRPVDEAVYEPGQDFRVACPYFDRRAYHRSYANAGAHRNLTIYEGGARERVFGPAGGYIQTKVPLLRYDLDCLLSGGQHLTNLPPAMIAGAHAAVLHFKYFASFAGYVRQEVDRGEHYGAAMQYREYARSLDAGRLTFYDPAYSVKLQDSRQLEDLGVLRRGELAEPLVAHVPPAVAPPARAAARPFWSVMITVYGRTTFLAQAIQSVLRQDPGPDAMEIVVVSDGGVAAEQRQAIAYLVAAMGRERVRLHQLAENAGHPHIFNTCLALSTGRWVHLLHDDDTVEPGFYAALAAADAAEPAAGAAFCRHRIVDEEGRTAFVSWLEQESPGILPDWLERIATYCRVQPPAMVVRRRAYEEVGGYTPAAGSAFDWEMWQRLAARFPVWYEPALLATFRQHSAAASHSLLRSGRQVADARRAIELAAAYLPATRRAELARAARERYAAYALQLAQRFLAKGDAAAALANLQAALACSHSEETTQALVHLLARLDGHG